MHRLKSFIPGPLLEVLRPLYHKTLAYIGGRLYGHPSREVKVVAITGTKGKSSVSEMVVSVLETAGFKVALASTIRFKIGEESEANKLKMTMPGRFFLQKFIRKAVSAQCDWIVIEMTSEGAKQHRHRGIALDALIFTNIAPEHIESHGSFANYLQAKFSIGELLVASKKRPRIIVANADDEYGPDFLGFDVEISAPFSRTHAEPAETSESGTHITFEGVAIESIMPGEFTIMNMLAAARFGQAIGLDSTIIRTGLEKVRLIPGRVEHIDAGQSFDVVVDYAHTLESLEKLYQAFPNRRKICVLGNTGGGRDTWKRPKMAQLAERYCESIILTDEDPYDEDPRSILDEMASGMSTPPTIILDRRRAIRVALSQANTGTGDAVLITGKGTDPYIMRAKGAKEEWSDALVAREELGKLLENVRTHHD